MATRLNGSCNIYARAPLCINGKVNVKDCCRCQQCKVMALPLALCIGVELNSTVPTNEFQATDIDTMYIVPLPKKQEITKSETIANTFLVKSH